MVDYTKPKKNLCGLKNTKKKNPQPLMHRIQRPGYCKRKADKTRIYPSSMVLQKVIEKGFSEKEIKDSERKKKKKRGHRVQKSIEDSHVVVDKIQVQ